MPGRSFNLVNFTTFVSREKSTLPNRPYYIRNRAPPLAGGHGRFHRKSSDFAPDFQNPDFCPRLCARLWRRVQERWAKNRGSTAKHGPRKPSVWDCAEFWRAAMAWSVCGEGARPPWSREKRLWRQTFLANQQNRALHRKAKKKTENVHWKRQTFAPDSDKSAPDSDNSAPDSGAKMGVWLQ